MFVLAEMQDVIRIEPHQFKFEMQRQIADELNKKLANKVVHGVGLFIVLHDLIQVGDSFILPGDGSSHTRVRFRAVIFRPFIGEVITGKIRRCSPEGVHVSVGFFHDIFIPADSLQYPSKFDQREQVWVWQYQSDEECHQLYMEVEEEIRFKVVDEVFVDVVPTSEPPSSTPLTPTTPLHTPTAQLLTTNTEVEDTQEQPLPYRIKGTISESGLGLTSWWTES